MHSCGRQAADHVWVPGISSRFCQWLTGSGDDECPPLQHLESEIQPGNAGVVAVVQDVALLLDVAHHAVAHNQVLVHHLERILRPCALVPDLLTTHLRSSPRSM
jgi:hypothetical protein